MTELTPEVLAKIRDILSPPQAQTKRATHVSDSTDVTPSTEHRFYYIEWKGFGTFVRQQDYASIPPDVKPILTAVLLDRLQPWYYVPTNERHFQIYDEEPSVSVWTHDMMCDWLRRKGYD